MVQLRESSVPASYGRYQTLFRIAAGGMAEVYAARVRGEAGFQKLVALKRMLPHLTDDERFVTMFMDEGKLAANIDSPNVVSTLDLGRADDGSLYLVMELVVGTTLSSILRNAAKTGNGLPVNAACEMLAQAAHGLHDAHEARTPMGAPLQLVHRDISPQNILCGVDGRMRITDFGVARAVLRRTKTSTGEFKGKLSYFSPEQCADKTLDRRSDIFSLGVVAWETLTMRRLFHAENPLAVLERVTRMPIPSAQEVRPEVPTAVAAVVAAALERDRDARYATAAEFGQALRAAARETVGGCDRGELSALVEAQGGEQLERIQANLKRSLATTGSEAESPSSFGEELDEPTEISSGIVMRPDEGLAPATPKATASGFQPDPRASHPGPPPHSSKTPIIIATLVAALGLTGGALLAVSGQLGGGDTTTTLPSEAPARSVAEPEPTATPAEAATATAEPLAEEASEQAPPEEAATVTTPEPTPAATSRSQRARDRRAAERRRRAAATTAPATTRPPPSTTPDPAPRPRPAPAAQTETPRSSPGSGNLVGWGAN